MRKHTASDKPTLKVSRHSINARSWKHRSPRVVSSPIFPQMEQGVVRSELTKASKQNDTLIVFQEHSPVPIAGAGPMLPKLGDHQRIDPLDNRKRKRFFEGGGREEGKVVYRCFAGHPVWDAPLITSDLGDVAEDSSCKSIFLPIFSKKRLRCFLFFPDLFLLAALPFSSASSRAPRFLGAFTTGLLRRRLRRGNWEGSALRNHFRPHGNILPEGLKKVSPVFTRRIRRVIGLKYLSNRSLHGRRLVG